MGRMKDVWMDQQQQEVERDYERWDSGGGMKHWFVVRGVEMWACPKCAREYVADKWHRPMTCEECGYEEQADPSDHYHAMRDERLRRAQQEEKRRQGQIVSMASEHYHDEGWIEVDVGATVSEVDRFRGDNGAYVQAWVWVDFSGTPLDKEKE